MSPPAGLSPDTWGRVAPRLSGLSSLTWGATTQSLLAWEADTGISQHAIRKRLQRGMPIEVALTKPMEPPLGKNKIPITPLSAAWTLTSWTHAHGRPPTWRECSGDGGLLWGTTYCECFHVSTWVSALARASLLVQSAMTPPGTKRCANAPECPTWIMDEGHHIRFCATCRRRACATTNAYQEPAFPRARLERWGVGSEAWGLREAIDWNGGNG